MSQWLLHCSIREGLNITWFKEGVFSYFLYLDMHEMTDSQKIILSSDGISLIFDNLVFAAQWSQGHYRWCSYNYANDTDIYYRI